MFGPRPPPPLPPTANSGTLPDRAARRSCLAVPRTPLFQARGATPQPRNATGWALPGLPYKERLNPMTDLEELSAPDSRVPDLNHAVGDLTGVPSPLREAMQRRGFADLTSVQRAVLEADFRGRDLRISSQTGSGKTVAIGLALAHHLGGEEPGKPSKRQGPSVLILVPTRELAMQVREEFCWLFEGVRGLGIEVVMGGASIGLERRVLSRGPRVVVGTPGRTLDHLKTGALLPDGIENVVLDESDRMLDMGFREELEAILERIPGGGRSHLVSATFPAGVRKLADRFQHNALHVEGTRLGAANVDIEHVAHVVDRHGRHAALVNLLLQNEGGRCLIFVERRVDASALAEKLSADGFPVQAFSGELQQSQRTRTLGAFRAGTINTLVSTDVAARGIDVPDIELVIHVDPPGDADGYVHRSGRTGRAGRAGRSVLLVEPRARRYVERLLGFAKIKPLWKPAPTAAQVRRQLRKKFRHEVHARLAADEAETQQQIDYAKGLLDGRDPAAVVAALLEMAQPKPTCEPMEVPEPREQAARGERDGRGARGASQGFVLFAINWGERSGAATNRLLGHICRRGQIQSRSVGAIEIGESGSTFEIEASAATGFEARVRRPDPRDPRLRIVRAGPQRGSGQPAGRPGPRSSWKSGSKRKPRR